MIVEELIVLLTLDTVIGEISITTSTPTNYIYSWDSEEAEDLPSLGKAKTCLTHDMTSYDKTNGQVTNEGPLFNDSNVNTAGESWYFSAIQASKVLAC